MLSLYALQQRLAITATEAVALLFVAGLLLAGLTVRFAQGQAVPYAAEHYAQLDADFTAQSAALRAEAASAAPVAADSTREDEPAGAQVTEAAPVAAASTAGRPRRAKPGPVRMNLNTASERLLQRLPGIGPALSGRIAAYRRAHGDFRETAHVVRVKGIGPKTYEKLEPYLFVEEESDEGDEGGS